MPIDLLRVCNCAILAPEISRGRLTAPAGEAGHDGASADSQPNEFYYSKLMMHLMWKRPGDWLIEVDNNSHVVAFNRVVRDKQNYSTFLESMCYPLLPTVQWHGPNRQGIARCSHGDTRQSQAARRVGLYAQSRRRRELPRRSKEHGDFEREARRRHRLYRPKPRTHEPDTKRLRKGRERQGRGEEKKASTNSFRSKPLLRF